MRIGIITGEYPPMEGGVGAFTHELAVQLVSQQHEVYVLTDSTVPSGVVDGITVQGSVSSWNRATLFEVQRWITAHQLDIVNIQYEAAAFKMAQLVHFLPQIVGIPTITTFHDLLVPYLFPKAGPLRFKAVLMLARHSSGVIVTNRQDEQRLIAEGGIEHLANIPIGSNISARLPEAYDPAEWRSKLHIPADAPVIGYFGFMNASKGVDTLLKAVASGVDSVHAHLVMIGGRTGSSDPTNAHHADDIDALISELGLQSRIHWTGFVNDEAVSGYLYACDVVALPYRDGVSLRRGSFMAALAHGCAIVTTFPEGELPEVQDRTHVLMVPPDDPDALAQAIAELLTDKTLRAKLQANARTLSASFNWDHIATKTVAFFSKITGATGP